MFGVKLNKYQELSATSSDAMLQGASTWLDLDWIVLINNTNILTPDNSYRFPTS